MIAGVDRVRACDVPDIRAVPGAPALAGTPCTANESRDAGSFRDPSGHVFVLDDEVVRSVHPGAHTCFEKVLASGILEDLCRRGLMVQTQRDRAGRALQQFIGARGETPSLLLVHPRLAYISYSHEWTFSQLKDAAICHLDVHTAALDRGLTLSDASAHNIQFRDGRPLHIDPLSLRPYVDGESWSGYHQFCRMFLLPLLVEAWVGIGFQPLLKGCVDGVPLEFGARLLPKHKVFTSLNAFMHVHMHARLTRSVTSSRPSDAARTRRPYLPRRRYVALLQEMRRWIASLRSGRNRGGSITYWSEYHTINSYSSDMQQSKARFVESFAQDLAKQHRTGPCRGRTLICDIGGNTGEYAAVVVGAGIDSAVIFDTDLDSLEKAYKRSQAGAPMLPLLVDVADPSPSLGWNQAERKGLNERSRGVSGVLALAVIHHLCIGRNLPLQAVVRWLVGFAPAGVIEFVPKSDPMVVGMLSTREDVFGDYDEPTFLRYLGEVAEVSSSLRLEGNGRLLVRYARRTHG